MFLPSVGKGSLDNVVYHEIALPCEYDLSTNLSDYDDSIVTQRMKLFDFFCGKHRHRESTCTFYMQLCLWKTRYASQSEADHARMLPKIMNNPCPESLRKLCWQ